MKKRKLKGLFKIIVRIITDYASAVIIKKLFISFILGAIIGYGCWVSSKNFGVNTAPFLIKYISPFGTVLIKMLKMIVVPIVFFTIIVGIAKMPIRKLGKVGLRLIVFYLFTSFLAVIVGITIAVFVNPGVNSGIDLQSMLPGSQNLTAKATLPVDKIHNVTDLLLGMFGDPISSLNNGNFVPIIIFALLVGFAINIMVENNEKPEHTEILKKIILVLEVINFITYKIVEWIMFYAPFGVFALSVLNFGVFGPRIIIPYLQVVLGVILGIIIMIFVVYGILFKIFTKKNFYKFIRHIELVMLTAFMTRSSAATLPVSLKIAAEKLKIKEELYNFSLPLGATVNMDGVCVHLPMLAVLAANLFGYDLNISHVLTIFLTTFLLSIGTGGIPG
jgi:proton glutamate symport protein